MKSVCLLIEEDNGAETTLKELAAATLNTGAARYVLATGKDTNDSASSPMLFSSSDRLMKNAHPLAPVMPINAASALRDISNGEILPDIKILALVRPCENRAAIELIKMKQIDPDRVILAVFDCMGTITSTEHRKLATEDKADTLSEMALDALKAGSPIPNAREACQVCPYHSAESMSADIVIGLAGIADKYILFQAISDMGETFLELMGQHLDFMTIPEEINEKRKTTLSNLKESLRFDREKIEADHKTALKGFDGIAQALHNCVGCFACMRVCPVCFCHHCFFESKQVAMELDHCQRTADVRGALRIPDDRLFYHLGRMSHMALSCVGCGVCEDACRMGVPVGALFRQASAATTPVFSYEAGRDLEEKFPLGDFHYDELHEYERTADQ